MTEGMSTGANTPEPLACGSAHPTPTIFTRRLSSPVLVASLLLFGSAATAQPPPAEDRPEPTQVEWLLEDIERMRSAYRVLQEAEARQEGEERTLIVLKMRKKVFELVRAVDELVADVVDQKQRGVERPPGLKRTRRLLLEMDRTIPAYIDGLEAEAAQTRTALREAPEESQQDLLIQLQGIDDILDQAIPGPSTTRRWSFPTAGSGAT
jgi:hypothetical protein